MIVIKAQIPPKDYLLTINVYGEDRCYLGIESGSKEKEFVLGISLLKPFHLFFDFSRQLFGIAVGVNSTGSIEEKSNLVLKILMYSSFILIMIGVTVVVWLLKRYR